MATEDNSPSIDSRRSRHTTKFRTLGDAPPVFGKRPHLAKEGREIANAAVGKMRREPPDFVDDAEDVTLAEVLKWLDRYDDEVREHQTATLCELLTEGLTFREAVTWYLYEHAGLTLREIYHVDEGKTKSASIEQDRQAVRNVAATIREAADKLGVDVALDDE